MELSVLFLHINFENADSMALLRKQSPMKIDYFM